MQTRIFFFLIGFGLMIVGCMYLILYLNLLTVGYNFSFYIHYISKRIECYYPVIGLIIILLTIFVKGENKDELYI